MSDTRTVEVTWTETVQYVQRFEVPVDFDEDDEAAVEDLILGLEEEPPTADVFERDVVEVECVCDHEDCPSCGYEHENVCDECGHDLPCDDFHSED